MTTFHQAEHTAGQALRQHLPRSAQAELVLPERDPVGILIKQNDTRLPDLVPVRIGRMLQSPFTYYRGTAAVMAHDLAGSAVSGPRVVSCGDAHISNFGLYASPERRLLFDLNDFDEGGLAPWEWDVKRLAASIVVGGRDRGFTDLQNQDAVVTAVGRYRTTLRELLEHSLLERYYFQVDTDLLERSINRAGRKVLRKTLSKARTRTSDQVMSKIVIADEGGQARIVDQPPVAQHVAHGSLADIERMFAQYRSTLRADVALLLSQFRVVDYILRIVGVGSVGTRCYVILLQGPAGEPLFLQAKEAPPSVLQTYGGQERILPDVIPPAVRGHEGYRVVSAQRVLQAQSDPFLGWIEGYAADDEKNRPVDYYWRQFRDMKGSVELDALDASQFQSYVTLCAQLLARAHSQSPAAARVVGYLGKADSFETAIAAWAKDYADQTERDFEALKHAAKIGRVPVEYGV